MPWMNWIHEMGYAYLLSKNLICAIHKSFKDGCTMCERVWTCFRCNEIRYGDSSINMGNACEVCDA